MDQFKIDHDHSTPHPVLVIECQVASNCFDKETSLNVIYTFTRSQMPYSFNHYNYLKLSFQLWNHAISWLSICTPSLHVTCYLFGLPQTYWPLNPTSVTTYACAKPPWSGTITQDTMSWGFTVKVIHNLSILSSFSKFNALHKYLRLDLEIYCGILAPL